MNRYRNKCRWRLLIKQRLLLSSTTELICPFPAWVSSGSVGSVDIDIGCQAAAAGPNSDFGKKRKPGQSRSEPRSPRWSAARARARYSQPTHTQLISFVAFFQGFFLSICYNPRTWALMSRVTCEPRVANSCFSVLHTPRSVHSFHCLELQSGVRRLECHIVNALSVMREGASCCYVIPPKSNKP